MSCFVIAEVGVNHNGNLDMALELIDASVSAGADAVKFQTFKADSITSKDAETVAYQKRAAGNDSQHDMLRKLELSDADHQLLAQRCAERSIEFMSTAFDKGSLDLLCSLGIKRIKVPSGEITNDQYLLDCASRGLPIILSTGMATMEEVRRATGILQSAQSELRLAADGSAPLTVLHCTSAYPTDIDDVNLLAMKSMAEQLAVPIGYSDHTLGIFVAPIAVAIGAVCIEKHITLDRTLSGPDHAASIEFNDFATMVNSIRAAEQLRGDGVKEPRPAELEARKLVRRGLKSARLLAAGTVLTADDIVILRPATGLEPRRFAFVLGQRLKHTLPPGAPITDSDIML